MRTFIQLRDGIGFATLITPADEPDHTVTPDHTTAVEVFTIDTDQFLNKKYDKETDSWSSPPLIRWAEVNQNGVPIEIGITVFSHQVPSHAHIMTDEVDGSYKFIDNQWVAPVIYVPSEIVEETPQAMIESPHVETEGE